MAVNYSASTKTARLNTTRDILKSQTPATASGSASDPLLVVGTSGLSGSTGVLATLPLPNAGVTVSADVLNLTAGPVSANATGTGTASLAELRTSGGTVVVSGLTVGTSGTDVVLGAIAISAGQTVTITSGTVTHG